VRDLEVRNANPPTATPALNELGTAFPTPTPTLVTPSVTPTPEFISNIPDGPGLFLPYNNQQIRGFVDVIGTANAKPNTIYVRYDLSISPTGANQWSHLSSSDEQIWQDVLYQLNTRQFPDGRYDLRLQVVFDDGNFDEYQVRNLYITNTTRVKLPTATPTPPTKGIFEPANGSIISGTIGITGTANIVNFQRWELAWSPSGEEQWSLLLNSTTAVNDGLLVRLDIRQLPPDEYDFRLRVFNWDNEYNEYFVRRLQSLGPTPTPTATFFPGQPTPPPQPITPSG